MKHPKHTIQKKGVTLLFAVIIASAALTVGLSVYSLLSGEIRLSGIERDSTLAFYASDSGVECFMYWKQKKDSTGVLYDPFSTTTAAKPIICGGVTSMVGGNSCVDPQDNIVPCDSPISEGFKTQIPFLAGTCTTFYVQPSYDVSGSGYIHLNLESFGETWPGCSGPVSPNVVQRSLAVRF